MEEAVVLTQYVCLWRVRLDGSNGVRSYVCVRELRERRGISRRSSAGFRSI